MSIFSPIPFGPNSLELEEGSHIIVSHFHGKQTASILIALINEAKSKIAYLRDLKSKVNILVILNNVEKMTTAERKVVLNCMNDMDFDRMAICEGTIYVASIAKFLILMSGKHDRLQYFKTEAEARTWLEA